GGGGGGGAAEAALDDWGATSTGVRSPALEGGRTQVIRGRPGPAGAAVSASRTVLVHPFLLPPVEPDEIGRLGNYRLLELLGQGAMALVFLAEDRALHRRVALVVVRADLRGDADATDRFLREARIMATIEHQHIVRVFQVGEEEGVVYLAMELLRGETLEDWRGRVGQPSVPAILRLGREIAAGL